MAVVFISVPTTGVVQDGCLSDTFLRDMAKLHESFPEISFINPMIESYALLPYLQDQRATWAAWGSYCQRIIGACDEVWVICYAGWETSAGVQGEVQCAKELQKPVTYMHPSLI